jgi:hypothetical protein
MEKHTGGKPLCRIKCLQNGNVKTERQEIGLGNVIPISLAQDRKRLRAVVNTVMKIRFPYNTCSCGLDAKLLDYQEQPCSFGLFMFFWILRISCSSHCASS